MDRIALTYALSNRVSIYKNSTPPSPSPLPLLPGQSGMCKFFVCTVIFVSRKRVGNQAADHRSNEGYIFEVGMNAGFVGGYEQMNWS